MRVICDPAIGRWSLNTASNNQEGAKPHRDRSSVAERINQNADRLGAGKVVADRPIIASGHQAWLWHPGILAKDLAVRHGADRLDAQPVHLVVDQDVYDPLEITVPIRRGDLLEAKQIRLGPSLGDIPAGCAPPVDPAEVQQQLRSTQQQFGDALQVDVQPLITAFEGQVQYKTLAEQMALVLSKLREPYVGAMPLLFASQLSALQSFGPLVQQMIEEARPCVDSYNRAARADTAAGIAPLRVDQQRVELPLWWMGWQQGRQRVFVDTSDSTTTLQLMSGEPIVFEGNHPGGADNQHGYLAPRALLMTAMLRRYVCDLFIHGKGGGLYDSVTDQWWMDWRGERLAPIAVVSADLVMDFDVPVTDQRGLEHAVWWAHHLPHNIDRAVDRKHLEVMAVSRKRELLGSMGSDRNRHRRYQAFEEIHQINRKLAQDHQPVLDQAQQQLTQARAGIANRAVALKRDWCFAFYDSNVIHELSESLSGLVD